MALFFESWKERIWELKQLKWLKWLIERKKHRPMPFKGNVILCSCLCWKNHTFVLLSISGVNRTRRHRIGGTQCWPSSCSDANSWRWRYVKIVLIFHMYQYFPSYRMISIQSTRSVYRLFTEIWIAWMWFLAVAPVVIKDPLCRCIDLSWFIPDLMLLPDPP